MIALAHLSRLTLVLFALIAAPAAAQETSSTPDISGSWTFETGPYNTACRITGRMFIDQPNENGDRSCEFVTFEDCKSHTAEVRQSCVVEQNELNLMIRSEIVAIEWQEPIAYGYAPDHWRLIIRDADNMTGRLVSASSARVTFTRESIPIS